MGEEEAAKHLPISFRTQKNAKQKTPHFFSRSWSHLISMIKRHRPKSAPECSLGCFQEHHQYHDIFRKKVGGSRT